MSRVVLMHVMLPHLMLRARSGSKQPQHFLDLDQLRQWLVLGESWEALSFEQDVVAIAVEHEALGLDLDGGNPFRGGKGLDAGDPDEVFRWFGKPAEAVAPGGFQGDDLLLGEGLGN